MSIYGYDPINETETPLAGLAQVDGTLSSTSENPIQNKAVTSVVNDMNNVLGAKNLLPNNATSQVINGVTFTVNSDGSVTCSGTATAEIWFTINNLVPITWPDNTYMLSKCPDVNTWGSVQLQLFDSSKTFLRTYSAKTNEDTLIVSSNDARYIGTFIVIVSGKTVNTTVYPMIRPAFIADDTYVPYAMTNRELTNKIVKTLTWNNVTSSAVTFLNTSDFASNNIKVYSNGIDCIITDEYRLSSNPQAISAGWISSLTHIKINTAYTPQYNTPLHGFFATNNHSPIFWQLTTSGTIAGFTGSTLTSIDRIPIYGRWTIHG